MTRLRHVFWLLLAGIAGLAVLFQVKYEVMALETQMEALNRQVATNQKAIHVLEAEWSYLNEPNRLAELTKRHLELLPLDATQLATFETVPRRSYAVAPGLVIPGETEEVQPAAEGAPDAARPATKRKPVVREHEATDIEGVLSVATRAVQPVGDGGAE